MKIVCRILRDQLFSDGNDNSITDEEFISIFTSRTVTLCSGSEKNSFAAKSVA
jgi:hypothetical protein